MHVSLISEEIACLIYLNGFSGRPSVVGPVGYASIDDPGFDVGMRALLSRGLALWVDGGIKLNAEAVTIAETLVEPRYMGYCVVANDGSVAPALLCERGGSTVLVSPLGTGAFDLATSDQGIPQTVLRLGRSATGGDGTPGWQAAVRFHGVESDPMDLLFASGRTAVLKERQATDVSDAELLDLLASSLVDLSVTNA